MELEKYLRIELSTATAKRYQRDIDFFFSLLQQGAGGQPLEAKAPNASYHQITEVVKQLRQQYHNPKTIRRILAAIKKYYDYLLYTGQRDDHPCQHLYLKDAKRGDIQLQDLFTEQELEKLLTAPPNRFRSYIHDQARNKLILSFLIYQGLMREEISRIRVEHLNLEKAEIYIPAHGQLNSRTLPLRARQIYLIYQYQKQPSHSSFSEGRLFIGQRGQQLSGDAIRRLVARYKYLFTQQGIHSPGRQLSCSTIRMSVCRNLLKSGKDLRAVQVYMGHKYPSSTERYKTSSTETLKRAILKYHPLG